MHAQLHNGKKETCKAIYTPLSCRNSLFVVKYFTTEMPWSCHTFPRGDISPVGQNGPLTGVGYRDLPTEKQLFGAPSVARLSCPLRPGLVCTVLGSVLLANIKLRMYTSWLKEALVSYDLDKRSESAGRGWDARVVVDDVVIALAQYPLSPLYPSLDSAWNAAREWAQKIDLEARGPVGRYVEARDTRRQGIGKG